MDLKELIYSKTDPYQFYLEHKFKIPFFNDLDKTYKIQKKILLEIIKKNKFSKFGKDFNFYKIKSIEDFQKFIKINTYDFFKEYIDNSKKGIQNQIISDKIEYYAITSGTTSDSKFISHSKKSINIRKEAWKVWINSVFKIRPFTFTPFGSILTFTSKPYEGYVEDGVTQYGSVSGKIHDIQPKFIKLLYTIPDEVLLIDDFKLKYYISVLFSLQKNLTLIVTPNPSTLIIFAQKFDKYYHQIIEDLETNNIKFLENYKDLDEEIKIKILRKFKSKRNKEISKRVKEIKEIYGKFLPKYYFRNLQTIGCWRGGSCGVYVKELPRYYGDKINIMDIGYMASEGRFSIPISNSNFGDGILDLHSNFYEFIRLRDWEMYQNSKNNRKSPKTYLANELEIGEKYYIIITNESGLYRYFMNDIVQVSGYYKKTPVIRFIQKGNYFSSLVGEKLSEWEIITALDRSIKNKRIGYITFFVQGEFEKNKKIVYKYYIEFKSNISDLEIKELEKEIDRNLSFLNIEYKEKRESQRINRVKIEKLPPNSLLKIKAEFSKNKIDSQVKVPKLITLEKDRKIINKILNKK